MIDVRDGKIYNLPFGEDTGLMSCDSEEKTTYTATSSLFVTTTCHETEIENTQNHKEEKTFFINVWNEPKKKFELIKTVEKTDIKKKTY
jgi:hypothetical protein